MIIELKDIIRIDQQGRILASGAPFGTSEHIWQNMIINGFDFPYPLNDNKQLLIIRRIFDD
ncbi:MAG: hypothetical protein PHX08_05205 [Lachnospiraceae bacterium]|nr:hypothetical protein [Lachnospiraceae bacterium]